MPIMTDMNYVQKMVNKFHDGLKNGEYSYEEFEHKMQVLADREGVMYWDLPKPSEG